MTFWMCVLSLALLVAAPILALFCDNKVLTYAVLTAGEILAMIYAFPVLISEFLCK